MSAGNAKIGKPAPYFEAMAVVDGAFKKVRLSDYKEKYVVLFFYPLDFTFVCPTEIVAFSDRVDDFRKVGCEVIGASVDSHFSHLSWVEKETKVLTSINGYFRECQLKRLQRVSAPFSILHAPPINVTMINTPRKQGGLGPMKIPLLSDLTKSISSDYGVLKEDEGISYRGLFVIDANGILRQITINDLPVGRSVDETLRLVQAFQHTDKHGEVCPAGWKPGSDTIIPDVQKSKEFFAKQA